MFRIARAILFLVTVIGVVNLLVPASHVAAQSPSLPTSLPSLLVPTNSSAALGLTVDAESSRLYTTDSQSIWMFNTIDSKLLKTNDVTGQTESGVGKLVVNPATHNLYASVSAGLPPSGHLVIIDSTTNTTTDKQISGLSGGLIGDIQLNPKSKRIYLTSSPIFDGFTDTMLTPSRIDVVDEASLKAIKSIDFNNDVIGSIAVNSKAETIYATNIAEAGTYTSKIWSINETSFAVEKPRQIKMAVFGMKYSEKADKIFVIGIKEDTSLWMQALNASLVPEPEVLVAKTSEPYTYIGIDMELSPLIDRMYASNGKELFVVDTSNNTVLGSLNVTAGNIAVDTLTGKIYVPKGNTNEIAVFQDVLPDSDGDGLPDLWEIRGVTINPGNGLPPQFIDLPKMGANPNKPDIFIQADWMENSTLGITRRPSPEGLKIVYDAFASSPYKSPTGSIGIEVHIDNGADSILNYSTGAKWGNLSQAQKRSYVHVLTADELNKNYLPDFMKTGRATIFHYVLFADSIPNGSTGSSPTPGTLMIVSLGVVQDAVRNAFGISYARQEGGTLMHELGHNLGLDHGGDEDVRWKPNYLSVMNYAFQLSGLTRNGKSGIYDYSRSELPPLRENDLDEVKGIIGGAASEEYGTVHYCKRGGIFDFRSESDLHAAVPHANGPIDWNCTAIPLVNDGIDKGITVRADVNGDEDFGILHGYNDWEHISFTKNGVIGKNGVTINLSMDFSHTDMTLEDALQAPPLEWVEQRHTQDVSTATAAAIPTTIAQITPTVANANATIPTQIEPTTTELSSSPPTESSQNDSRFRSYLLISGGILAILIALALLIMLRKSSSR